jgi:hypothetical protein
MLTCPEMVDASKNGKIVTNYWTKANQGKTKPFLHGKYIPKIALLGVACSTTKQNF